MAKGYHRTYVPSYKSTHTELYIMGVTMREYTFFTELRFKAENENLLVDLTKDLKKRVMTKMGTKRNQSQIADNLIRQLLKKGLMVRKCRGTYMLNPRYANKINILPKFKELMDVYSKLKRAGCNTTTNNIVELSAANRN